MIDNEVKRFQKIINVVLMLIAATCIIPFLLLVISSLTEEVSIVKNGYSFFPAKWSFAAYKYLEANASMILHAYGITVFVTVIGTAGSLILTTMLAYPLARKNLPHRNILTFIVVFTMLFNGGLVPTYLVYTQIFHIKDTIFALLVPSLLMSGFNVMLVRTYFVTSIPDALIEAAKIDGASEFTVFRKIALPLAVPIITTVGLLESIHYWNDWNNGLIYLTNSNLFSIQNLLNRMMQDIQFLANNSDLNAAAGAAATTLPTTTVRMAIAVVAVLPLFMAYPFFQRYFIKGITSGSVK